MSEQTTQTAEHPWLELPESAGGGRVCLAELRGPFSVGRASACDLTLAQSNVSRCHFELLREAGDDGGILLVDRAGKNPTRVDGKVVSGSLTLVDGMVIRLPGDLELLYRDPANPAPPPPPSRPVAPPPVAPPPVAVDPHSTDDLSGLVDAAELAAPVAVAVAETAPGTRPDAASKEQRQGWFAMGIQLSLMAIMGLILWIDPRPAPPPVRPTPSASDVDPLPDPLAGLSASDRELVGDDEQLTQRFARPRRVPIDDWISKVERGEIDVPDDREPKTTREPEKAPVKDLQKDLEEAQEAQKRAQRALEEALKKQRKSPTSDPPKKPADQPSRPPVEVVTPPLPKERQPLVVDLPRLEGASGETERVTVRLYELPKIVAGLASRIAPRIAPAESGTREARDRLVVWVVDVGRGGARLLPRLAAQIEAHFGDRQAVSHALVAISKGTFYGPPGTVGRLTGLMRSAAGQADADLHDPLSAVRGALTKYRAHRDKAIVVVTVDNADVEASLEKTANRLRGARTPLFAIVPESAQSDAFWFKRAAAYDATIARARAKKLTLAGPESAIVEMPWGWRLPRIDPQQTVASGFAGHAWSRLAATSGGAAYLYHPGGSGASFCATVACAVCSGRHRGCGTPYSEHRLGQLEPTSCSRGKYARWLTSSTTAGKVRKAWTGARKIGLLASAPPRSVGPAPVEKPKRAEVAPDQMWITGGSAVWRKGDIEDAEERAAARRRGLGPLSSMLRGVRPGGGTPFTRRAKANALAMRVSLLASDVTLVQQLLACKEIRRRWPAKESRAIVSITVQRVPLCHGVGPLRQLDWPGGKAMDQALGALEGVVEPVRRAYANTPWELLVRRTIICRYRVFVQPVPKPQPAPKRPKTKKPKKPKTKKPKKPKSDPKRPPKTDPPPKPPPTRPDRTGPDRSGPGPGPDRTR